MKRVIIFLLALLSIQASAKTSAIIEKWETRLSVNSSNRLSVHEIYRVKILDERGYQFAVYSDYYNSFRKIKSLSYSVYDDTGHRRKKFGRNDAVDIMFNQSYEIGDARMIMIDPEYRNFPFVVEIEVEVTYKSFMYFPEWRPRMAPDLEVKEATLIFESPEGYEFSNWMVNGVGTPKRETTSDGQRITWELHDLDAIVSYTSKKAFIADQPAVYLAPREFVFGDLPGSFESWREFGNWYDDLNKNRNALTPETKAYLDARDTSNVAHVVKEIYAYMQKRTRYVSIQLGIGGFQAIAADEVDRSGYGDCKALSNYMKAMLDYLHISSNFVLVNAGRDVPDIIRGFPSNQFNHVFLAVPLPSDTLWLECTSQTSPPSHIGTFTDDRDALWVDHDHSQIIHTPVYEPDDNVKRNISEVKLLENDNAEIFIKLRQQGVFYDDIMGYKMGLKNITDKINYHKFDYNDFTIKSFHYNSTETGTPQLDLQYELEVKSFARKLSEKMVLPMSALQSVDKEVELDPLTHKCEIRRGFTLEDDVVIHLPENFRTEFLPDPVTISSAYGSVEFEIIQDDTDRIRIKRKIVVRKGDYSNAEFDKFYNIYKQIRSIEQIKVVLTSKT